MRIPRIYLETSVFNFFFADDALDKKADTLKLFEEIRKSKFSAYTSAYAINELKAAPQPKRDNMLNLIPEYGIRVLEESDEAVRLAETYVAEGIIPGKYITDAVHIAAASIDEPDIVVSWNFKHIVKMKTIKLTEAVNLKEGYKKIMIHSPTEVIDND